jgi:endonuclease YncB( thermonuclease family)
MRAKPYFRPVAIISAAFLAVLTAPNLSVQAADLVGAATRIGDDASLSIHGRPVRLAGIYVPPTSRFCQTFQSPVRCGSRAALALDFHIGARFVYCNVLARGADGSAIASCWITGRYLGERDDLAAWLIWHGWALALPDAPFEYVALERIARAQGRGVWGFIVDRID